MVTHTSEILRCKHQKIVVVFILVFKIKVFKAIFQHYAKKIKRQLKESVQEQRLLHFRAKNDVLAAYMLTSGRFFHSGKGED